MAVSDTLTIRIDPNLKKALAKAAAEDDRSVTSFIVHTMRKEIAAREREHLGGRVLGTNKKE